MSEPAAGIKPELPQRRIAELEERIRHLTARLDAEHGEHEERFRALTEIMPQMVWSCRADGYCDYLSPQWTAYTGLPLAAELGWGWLEAIHPDDRERVGANWREAIEGKSEYNTEYRLRRHDGAYRWFKARAARQFDDRGRLLRVHGTSTDIEDQRRAIDEARESRERLRSALDASGTGTFRWVFATGEVEWDGNLSALFGLAPERRSIRLSDFLNLVHADDREEVSRKVEDCRLGSDFVAEFRVVWPDRSLHWLLDKGRVILDAGGNPASVTGACVDITSRKKAEENLQRTNEDLRQFAYAASHDLQEPLRMVASFTQLLKRRYGGKLDGEADQFIEFAVEGAHRIELLLEGLRIYWHVSDQDDIAGEITDCGEIVNSVVAMLQGTGHPRPEFRVGHDLPMVRAANVPMTQLFQNLLGNAVKYRHPERIPVVEVRSARGRHEWIFSVRDNGIGIDPRYSEQVFKIFKRLHSKEYSGTGIGLAICRKIVERLGGRIWVQPNPEGGSDFRFTIPA